MSSRNIRPSASSPWSRSRSVASGSGPPSSWRWGCCPRWRRVWDHRADGRARHLGVRAGCGRGRASHRGADRTGAPEDAVDRVDGGVHDRQRRHRVRAELRRADGRAVRGRSPARRLLRCRGPRGGAPRGPRPAGQGGRSRHDGAVGGQRRRRSGRLVAGSDARLAQRLRARGGDRCGDTGRDLVVGARARRNADVESPHRTSVPCAARRCG